MIRCVTLLEKEPGLEPDLQAVPKGDEVPLFGKCVDIVLKGKVLIELEALNNDLGQRIGHDHSQN